MDINRHRLDTAARELVAADRQLACLVHHCVQRSVIADLRVDLNGLERLTWFAMAIERSLASGDDRRKQGLGRI